jgi:hypothetical protein
MENRNSANHPSGPFGRRGDDEELDETPQFDTARFNFRHDKSCATAGRYLEETLELLHEDRIDRDTLIYAVHEVAEWLNQVKKLSF